ncbi:MAG: helix-turn-helix domain-containing protein [Mycobacterium sp.]
MSIVQARDDRMILTVDEAEIAEARTVCSSLAEVRRTTAKIEFEVGPPGGRRVAIPTALAGLMREVIDGVSRGATMTIHSMPRELTTTTAAKMLGISRPTLMKLIAEKKLPAHKVGSHTRLSASDVLAFRKTQREGQRRAFDELRKLDEEVGIEP